MVVTFHFLSGMTLRVLSHVPHIPGKLLMLPMLPLGAHEVIRLIRLPGSILDLHVAANALLPNRKVMLRSSDNGSMAHHSHHWYIYIYILICSQEYGWYRWWYIYNHLPILPESPKCPRGSQTWQWKIHQLRSFCHSISPFFGDFQLPCLIRGG